MSPFRLAQMAGSEFRSAPSLRGSGSDKANPERNVRLGFSLPPGSCAPRPPRVAPSRAVSEGGSLGGQQVAESVTLVTGWLHGQNAQNQVVPAGFPQEESSGAGGISPRSECTDRRTVRQGCRERLARMPAPAVSFK